MSTLQRRIPLTGSILCMLIAVQGAHAQLGDPEQYGGYRSRGTVTVGGTVRDFIPSGQTGGHPDFGKIANTGVGRYVRIPADALDSEGKPALHTRGFKVRTPWRDAAGRTIIPTKPYINALPGDTTGTTNTADGAGVTSASTFAQWFRTTPGVNSASSSNLSMTYNAAAHAYIFDGTLDNFRGAADPDYSYSFSAEIPFIYEAGHDWWVSIRTSGDAYVFVDDQLVIDNGSGMGARPALAVDDTILIENSSVVGFDNQAASAVSTNSTAARAIRVLNSGRITGDALVGPGGDPASGINCDRSNAISGDTGTLGARVPIAVVSMPTGMPASSGNREILGGTATLTGDLHYRDLLIRNGAIVTVNGTCRVLCGGTFTLRQGSEIRVSPGARLEVYAQSLVNINNTATINRVGGDPDSVIIACLGTAGIIVEENTNVWGHLACPLGLVDIGNSSTVYGSVTARSARLHNTGRLTGMGSGFTSTFGGSSTMGQQRIHLDRLGALDATRTHFLRIFYANRTNQASPLRLETNMLLVRVAVIPSGPGGD